MQRSLSTLDQAKLTLTAAMPVPHITSKL